MAGITVEPSSLIDGVLKFTLVVHGDDRGWFKENYQQAELQALGLPVDFVPVQNNVSYNAEAGVTRGIHAEPWEKYIGIGFGEVFSALVDLRAGSPSYGLVETFVLGPADAIFVPRGIANSFQSQKPNTVYTYLVNAHWSPEVRYTMVNLADPTLAIRWPIPLDKATVSDKDQAHPMLDDVVPMEVD